MNRFRVPVCVVSALMSGLALAGSDEVQYDRTPDWVVAPPVPTGTASPPGAPFRMEYLDYQIRAGASGDELFNASRIRILKPEALAAGNVTLTWSPDVGDATVHYLRILRSGQSIDVLKTTRFQVLRREGDLENAMLNGQLTAVLQVPGLQVGDELEFAATVRHRDLTLGDHSFGAAQLPAVGLPGAYRVRLLWPQSRPLVWRASGDLPVLKESVGNGQKELVYELRDPHAAIVTQGAPPRFNLRRLIEYSDFSSWQEISARLWPLFSKATELGGDSPVRAEIARIAASTRDPVQRAEAALQLVEENIRYVYVGLDGGNFRPAGTEETWKRRFGDCKAKSVLLVAVLRELGIPAEPVLVQSAGGDGTNERLPSPGQFDHMLVRATVAGKVYWLDGTRLGDKSLSALTPPPYRWVLPLRDGGADLEANALPVPRVPQAINVIEIDASGGFEKRARVKAQLILRGDEAYAIRTALSAMTSEDAERAIKAFWDKDNGWMESEAGSWKYDDQNAVLRLSVLGTGKLDWEGGDEDGRKLNIFGAGFTPPAEYRRPREQDQNAPWETDYPAYRCWATQIRLPPPTAKWRWDYRSKPVNRKLGPVTYWRVADMNNGVVRTVMSRRVDVPEITAADAQEVNRQIAGFDNNMSDVLQIGKDQSPESHAPMPRSPFNDSTDWMSPVTPCQATD